MPERPTVLVDARNVLRSQWPNIPERELVRLCRAWAEATGVRAVVVFDGEAPRSEDDEHCVVVGTGAETADDWIARAASELAKGGEHYWLVTSDRELRDRAGSAAERVIGGGGFTRVLRGVS